MSSLWGHATEGELRRIARPLTHVKGKKLDGGAQIWQATVS